ncbi:MAG: hypothetical protein Q4C70_01220 [Planctomycetia bacterium]|nr:hypothetical protein [Planctomycetia bacterium]
MKFRNYLTVGTAIFSSLMGNWTLFGAEINAEKVEKLVKALGGTSVTRRSAAEEELLELGPGVLPFLPETVRSPEAKMRLNRVRVALERQNIEDSLEAGSVSLRDFTEEGEIPVSQISKMLAEQTQNTVEFSLPADAVFTLPKRVMEGNAVGNAENKTLRDAEGNSEQEKKAGEIPFWEFLDSFCDEFHLAPQSLPGKKGLKLVSSLRTVARNAGENPRVAYLKPIRLEPLKVTSSILLSNEKPSTILQLEMAWEPRILPVFAYLKLEEAEFFADSGKAGEVEQMTDSPKKMPVTEYEILIGADDVRALCELPISGSLIPAGAEKMTLRGTLSAVACGTRKDFVFTELEEKLNRDFPPVSHRTAAVLVTLSDLRTEIEQKNNVKTETEVDSETENTEENKEKNRKGNMEINKDGKKEETEGESENETVSYLVATLRYRYEEAHEAMESHRTWIYENDAELVLLNGERIISERSEMLRQTPNEIATDIYFPVGEELLKDLKECKLVFPRPCGIYEVEIPFELREIPLP